MTMRSRRASAIDAMSCLTSATNAHATRAWFDPLYRDLDDGGTSEFLYFLQNLKLGDWHPREILKTAETTEQQRMSGDSVSQWSQACIDADAIIGAGRGPYGSETTLRSRDANLSRRRSARRTQGFVGKIACDR